MAKPHETGFGKKKGVNVELEYAENSIKKYRFGLEGSLSRTKKNSWLT
jgi:hypothetical protein